MKNEGGRVQLKDTTAEIWVEKKTHTHKTIDFKFIRKIVHTVGAVPAKL